MMTLKKFVEAVQKLLLENPEIADREIYILNEGRDELSECGIPDLLELTKEDAEMRGMEPGTYATLYL